MQFSEIPGLKELKSQLIGSFQKGKVAHAQLFAGRQESAALPLALAYISYLMCENKTETDSCGTCPNCIRIRKLVHPDVHLIFPKTAASDSGKYEKTLAEALPAFRLFVQNHPYGAFGDWAIAYGQENKNLLISREDSRQLLKNVSMRSVEGGYKILLIWIPELMNPGAANAILKVLEEPPENTIYVMVTYSYDTLLATITSRTQLVTIPPNTETDIADFLVSKGIENEKAMQLASLADGKPGLAIKLLEEDEASQDYESFQKWMLECWNKDLTALVTRSEDFSKSGKALQKRIFDYSVELIRNAVVTEGSGKPLVIKNPKEQDFIEKFSSRLGLKRLEKLYNLINEGLLHLERNANPRITHLNVSLSIIERLNEQEG